MAVIELDWKILNADRAEASIDAQQTAVRQLRREYEALARSRDSATASTRSTRETIRANRDASNSFQEFSRSVAGTGQQLSAVQQRLQRYRQANIELASSLGLPVESIRQLNTSLGRLPDRTAQVAESYIQLRNAGLSSADSFQQLNQQFGITQQQFDQLQRVIGASNESLLALAGTAGGVSAAIAGIFRGGLDEFVQFERTVNTIAAITGQTEDAIQGIADEAQRLGNETQFSATEVAQLGVQLTRAGFSAEQAGDAFDGVVNTALATNESLTSTGRIIGQVINQFDEFEAASSGAIGDTLVAAVNNSATSITGIGSALRFVGGVANISGQSLTDVSTALGLLANNGLVAGQAGRNLAQVFQRLVIASANNTAAFQELGIEVRDANGNLLPLLDVLPEIRQRLDELGTRRDVIVQSLFGTQGGRALDALLSNTNEQIEELRTTIGNAAGESERAADVLQSGLPGALATLDSVSESTARSIGEALAPAAQLLIEAATGLLQTFNELPVGVRNALVGFTGFVGVLAAATAAIASYTVASRALQLNQVSLAASQVASTAATAANTVVVGANSIAQANLGAVLTRVAAGFNASAASAAANSAAIGSGALAIARFAGQIALLVAAFQSVNIAFSRFNDGGEDFVNGADQIREGLLDIQLEAGVASDAIESVIPDGPPPTDFVDGLVNQLNNFNSFVNNLVGLPEDFLRIPTATEESLNDARLGVEDLSNSIFELVDRSTDLATGFSGTEDELRQAAAIQELFAQAIDTTRSRLEALDASSLGQEAYIELDNRLRVNITLLEQQRDAFNSQISPAQEAGEAISESVQQATEDIEALNDALNRQAEALEARRAADRESAQISFDEGSARDRLADRRAVQAEQRAFQQEQAQLQQSLEAQLQQRESAFNEQERLKAQENERAIQQFKEDGARQIELIQSNSAERINRLNEDAARQIEQARQAGFDDETGRTRIEQLELEAERSLQLEDVKDRRERRRLEEEFEAEDELAQRRFEAFAPVREERQRLEAEIAEIERQNQEEVEAIRLQTEQNIADFRQALQETEQEFRLQQEEALATRRQTLEQQLQVERENLESQLEARALAFQTQQENAALEAQFERQRIQREFQAEQRRLDEESAERVAEIRGGVGTGDAAIPGRKTGGPVTAGQPYIVGEAGPEYFVPQHSGQIINHHQSVRIAQQALAQQPILARPLAPNPVVNVQGMSNPEIVKLLSAIANNTSMKGGTAAQILRERRRF